MKNGEVIYERDAGAHVAVQRRCVRKRQVWRRTLEDSQLLSARFPGLLFLPRDLTRSSASLPLPLSFLPPSMHITRIRTKHNAHPIPHPGPGSKASLSPSRSFQTSLLGVYTRSRRVFRNQLTCFVSSRLFIHGLLSSPSELHT